MLARLRLEPDTCRDPRRLNGTPEFGPLQSKRYMLSYSCIMAVIPGRIDYALPRLQVPSTVKSAPSPGTGFQSVTMTAGRH